MRRSSLFLAGAAGLALAAGVASAQTVQSWGDSTTTYFYSPSTSDSYMPGGAPPSALPPADFGAPVQSDPLFHRAPEGYGMDRHASDRPFLYGDADENLGQGSGHSGYMLGR